MCFAPKWRALFRHRDVQKWAEHVVLLAFWPGSVLRATIFHLSSGQIACTRHLSEPTFGPSGHKTAEKHSASRLSYLFTDLHLLSSYFLWLSSLWSSFFFSVLFLDFLFCLSSLTLPISAPHLSILSEVWLQNFPSVMHAQHHYFSSCHAHCSKVVFISSLMSAQGARELKKIFP